VHVNPQTLLRGLGKFVAVVLAAAGEILAAGARELEAALTERARARRDRLRRSQPRRARRADDVAIKLAGFAMEARRNAAHLERAFAQASVGAISGAVGT